jgi:hypothetical protein
MNKIGEQLTAVLVAVIGVAILAVIVSKNANTAGVLQAGGQAFSAILGAAESPVSGGGVSSLNLSGLNLNPTGLSLP